MRSTASNIDIKREIYKPYISIINDYEQSLDIIFITIPPPFEYQSTAYNDTSFQHPNSGLAYLSTQIYCRTNYIPAICYAHQIQILLKNGKHRRLDVDALAMLSITSKAKIIGLSLMSPLELIFASKLIDKVRFSVKKLGCKEPEFIAGGAQATLDPQMTSKLLKIGNDHIFIGRALPELLVFLDKKLGGASNINQIDYSAPVLPQYLIVNNNKESITGVVPILTLLKSGGLACIGKKPCSFCTAYFIGKSIKISDNSFFLQIDWLKKAGIKNALAGDNVLNLSNHEIREIVIKRIRYAYEKNVPIKHFLTRPDFISNIPIKYLEMLRKYSVESIMLGVETGNIDTLIAMRKVQKGFELEYFENCKIAAKKISKANIKPTFNVIVGYPVNDDVDEIADNETIYFLIELLKITNFIANFEIHPLFISPGSYIYQQYIKKGVTQSEILNIMYYNESAFYKYKDNLVRKTGKSIEQFIFEGNNVVIDNFLAFIKKRRLISKKGLIGKSNC